MNPKEFLSGLFHIADTGRLASLKRIFGSGGSEVGGLKILAQLGVQVSDPAGSIPYKIVAYLYGRGVANGKVGNIAKTLHTAAMIKENGKNENGELSFDKRFDMVVASRDYHTLMNHFVKMVPFLDDHVVDYEALLRDLLEWSRDVRDRWIETYYQS